MNHIDLKNKTVFVTGSAGFIGSNLVLELLRTQSPIHIIGLDNMNNYYDVNIKEWRLKEIENALLNITILLTSSTKMTLPIKQLSIKSLLNISQIS